MLLSNVYAILTGALPQTNRGREALFKHVQNEPTSASLCV